MRKALETRKPFAYTSYVNPAELRSLLIASESRTVAFKQQANDTELVEAVVCLANGGGGYLVLGVADSGRVVGAGPRHGDHTDPDRVEALILSSTRPSVFVSGAVVITDGEDVLVVKVPTPTTVVATSGGKYVRRAIGDATGKPECLPMEPHEVLVRVSSVGAQDFSKFHLRGLGDC